MPSILRVPGTFVPMPVHVGKVLRELYLSTGLKMERFRVGIPFSDKTIYYHFKKADLNTSILEKYDAGLKKLGFNVNIWDEMAKKSKAPPEDEEEGENESVVHDPLPRFGADDTVADLLRRAATLLDEQKEEES
jgi:hypothetical protein